MASKAEKKPVVNNNPVEEPVAEKASMGKKPKAEKWVSVGKLGGTAKKGRKGLKKSVLVYDLYIFKVLNKVHPNVGISPKAMSIMKSFINDIYENLIIEATSESANKNPIITISP
jgi:histone H2B